MANRLGPEVRGNTTRPGPIAPTSTDTWFVDCVGSDPSTGTAVEQSWFNRVIANLRSLFTQVGMSGAAGAGDDNMVRDGIALQTQAGQMSYAIDTGAANAIAVTLTPAPLNGYQAGLTIRVKIGFQNSGAVTINVNGLGSRAVVFAQARPIGPAEFRVGDILNLVYDGTNFQCLTVTQIPHTVASPVIYVRTDGNDANDGSVNSAAKAMLTVNGALAKAASIFNLVGRTLTIQLGIPGTYASFVVSNIPNVSIIGDIANIATYIISGTPQCAVVIGASCTLRGLTFSSTGTNHVVQANGGAQLNVQNCAFGGSTGGPSVGQICASAGSSVIIGGPISFNVGSGYLIYSTASTIECASITLTCGAITIATAVVDATNAASIIFDGGAAWAGSTPTGKRYNVDLNAVINSGGGGANFIPGTIAGTFATGGQYAP